MFRRLFPTCRAIAVAGLLPALATAQTITDVTPDRVSADGTTTISIEGSGFTDSTGVLVGDKVLVNRVVLSSSRISGKAPALDLAGGDTPGPRSVTVQNPGRPPFEFRNAVTYFIPLDLESIEPTEVSYLGKTPFSVHGQGFTEETVVQIGPIDFSVGDGGLTLVDSSTLTGRMPAQPPTEAPLSVLAVDPVGGEAILPDAVSFVGPLEVLAVIPDSVAANEVADVTVGGLGFTPETRVFFGETGAVPGSVSFIDTRRLGVQAPALPPGTYSVTARDLDEGTGAETSASLPDGLGVVGPAAIRITDVDPLVVSTEGGTPITIQGEGFRDGLTFRIGGRVIEDASLVGASSVSGTTPALDAGFHVVDVLAMDGTVADSFEPPVEAVAPTIVESMQPDELSYLGNTPLEVLGEGFRPEARLRVAGVLLPGDLVEWVDATKLRADGVPFWMYDLPHNEPLDVTVEYAGTAAATLESAVTILSPFRVDAVAPDTLREGEPATLTVTGLALTPTTTVIVGGEPAPVESWEGARRMRVRVPGLPAGFHDLVAQDRADGGEDVESVLRDALTVEAEPVPTITSIEPFHVSSLGGDRITIRGSDFTPQTEIRLGFSGAGTVLIPTAFEASTVLSAVLPELEAGVVDAVAREPASGSQSRLAAALEIVSATAPAFQEIEATVVHDVAEISWTNLFPLEEIHVYRNGVFLETLPGNRTTYSDVNPLPGKHIEYSLIGKFAPNAIVPSSSMISRFAAAVRICPPPLDHGTADRGGKDFLVFGQHAAHDPNGGRRKAQEVSSQVYQQVEPVQIETDAFNRKIPRLSDFAKLGNLRVPAPNELMSGFTLFEPATKLRFEIHGAKIQSGAELSLRILLESVTEGVERAQELTFPDILVKQEHGWLEVTYNTENPPEPGSPIPPDTPLPPHDPLPPADYLVRVYAVGGILGESHYSVSSDFSPDQILVPGLGCPPYPLVRITDITGRNANPIIEKIVQAGDPIIVGDRLCVTLAAKVVDPDTPPDPIVSYSWTVDRKSLGVFDKVTAGDSIALEFPSYGYYPVKLAVRDRRCGHSEREFIVKVRPPCVTLPAAEGPNFTFPVPKPRELHVVTNLPGGLDRFLGAVEGEFTAFVVDPEGCGSETTAETLAVQFGLFRPQKRLSPLERILGRCEETVSPANLIQLTNGSEARVQACLVDLDSSGNEDCLVGTDVLSPASGDTTAGRFWRGRFADLSLLPDIPQGEVILAARGHPDPNALIGSPLDSSPGWSAWRPIRVYNTSTLVRVCGSARIQTYQKPDFLDDPAGYNTGSYEAPTQTYTFDVSSAAPGASSAPAQPTPDLPINVGNLATNLPPMGNEIGGVDQNGTVTFSEGTWDLSSLRGGVQGQVLGGGVTGSKNLLGSSGQKGIDRIDKANSDFDPLNLSYDYCRAENLFDESFNSVLFNSPIYCCAIGPVPVTVWAVVTFGADISLDTQFDFHLRGLPEPGENPFEANFYLLPEAGIRLSASIRADILLGIISLEGGLDFVPSFEMPFHIGVNQAGLSGPHLTLDVKLWIGLWFKGCVFWVLCIRQDLPILHEDGNSEEGKTLVSYELTPESRGKSKPPNGLCTDGKSALADLRPKGVGGDPGTILLSEPDYQLTVASSPDGERQIAVGKLGQAPWPFSLITRRRGEGIWKYPPINLGLPLTQADEYLGTAGPIQLADGPKAIFTDNDTVVVAWTQDFSQADPVVRDAILASDEDFGNTLDGANRLLRRRDVVYATGYWSEQGQSDLVLFDPAVRMVDDPETALRADGQVVVAPVPDEGSFWAAWVRYEEENVILPAPGPNDTPSPNLKKTGIYARKISPGHPPGPLHIITSPDNAIDIEPCLAVGQDGTACLVWLHDPNNGDLITDNRNRQILFSKYDGSGWTAPSPVLSDPSPYPGILEPELAVFDAGNGLMTFTACPLPPEGLEEEYSGDSGLGGTRLLYTVKLSGGAQNPVWGEPVLMLKKCETPIYARWALPVLEIPALVPKFELPLIDVVIHEVGTFNRRAGSGNQLALTYNLDQDIFTEPVNLTPDDRVHNTAAVVATGAGEILMVHQSPFPSQKLEAIQEVKRRQKGIGVGEPTPVLGGVLVDGIMLQGFERVADPEISHCEISDAYVAPGAPTTVTVAVKNNGFASTPADEEGNSTLGLRFVYIVRGEREVVDGILLPKLQPGEEFFLPPIELTMPREPVRLLVEVDVVPGEIDPDNNVRDCALGAQPPQEVVCAGFLRNGERAVRLAWDNGSLYDRVCVYRDGGMRVELPGTATSYLDTEVGFTLREGEVDAHIYQVRGVVADSMSVRSGDCVALLPELPPLAPTFRRSDTDGNGIIDITDPIVNLEYQFLGRSRPPCLDAADVDDSGTIDLTDPIVNLEVQFLGRGVVPPPGVRTCGEDPTPDAGGRDLGCEAYPEAACDQG